MSSPGLSRVVRRETHSPRTVAMFVAVILLILALAYVGLEIVLYLAAQPALLLGPGAGLAWLVGLPSGQGGALAIAGAAVLVLIGLVFIVLAITPGRLSKQQLTWGDRAVVVDNGVIAASLAQHVSDETGIARENVTVGVAHRTIDVTVRPGAGVPLERDEVKAVADAEVDSYQLARRVTTRVRVERPKESELDA
ncbi:MAG: DUF6286 domain-containing protein [Microbacterium sp.]